VTYNWLLNASWMLSIIQSESAFMKKRLNRIWFWLTTAVECSWCKRTLHRAWIPLPPQRITDSIRIRRVSHTICASCAAQVIKTK